MKERLRFYNQPNVLRKDIQRVAGILSVRFFLPVFYNSRVTQASFSAVTMVFVANMVFLTN
jgi:hypothetical protein